MHCLLGVYTKQSVQICTSMSDVSLIPIQEWQPT